MASTYPTALDAFTNPTGTSLLTSPDHAQQHSDLNDAVEALEAKVAIGATVLGTYTAYTPTFSGLTVGNGTLAARFCRVNNYVHDIGYFTFGSTSSIGAGGVFKTLPVNAGGMFAAINGGVSIGGNFFDASANTYYPGFSLSLTSATNSIIRCWLASGTYVQQANLEPSVPFTWTTGDRIIWNTMYEAA